jgi:TonB family protein
MRIDRILDETRQIPVGLNRRWCVALLACSLPLVYAAAVLQVAPALALEQPTTQEKTVVPPARQPETPAPAPGRASKTAEPPSAPRPPAAPPAAAAHTDDDVEQYVLAQRSGTAATQTPAIDPPPAPRPPGALAALTPVTRVEPEYPRLARETGARGIVELIATVAPDGHVTDVKVVHGPAMLLKAAASAVMQWTYGPQPAETQTLGFVNFPGSDSPRSAGGSIQQAVLISKKDPAYPQEARRAGVKGVVELVATIGTDGHVKAARTLHGDPLLAQSAEEAVLKWRYKPTLLNGTAVEAQTQVFVNFIGEPAAATVPSSAAPAGAFQPAALISRKEPIHPGGDLQSLAGTVIFQAMVGLDGRLSNIRVTDGPAELVPAALEAVKQWVYRPAKINGQPVEADTQIGLRFTPGR